MASHAFGAIIDVESSTASNHPEAYTSPKPPQKAFERIHHSVPLPQQQNAIELDHIHWGSKNQSSWGEFGHDTPSGTQNPGAADLEMTRPASPEADEQAGVDVVQSFSNPPMNRFRMLSVCSMLFGNGMVDAAPGALIPYIEKEYKIGYAITSLIFVTNAFGFISAAIFVDVLRARVGRARTLMAAEILMITGNLMIVCTPPFPVVVLAFLFLGLGEATNTALSNVFAVNLNNSTKMLGSMHGSYGVGATIGPLIATAMVTKGKLLWSRYYLLTLSVTVFNFVFAGWSFWHYESESSRASLETQRTASRIQNSTTPDHANEPSRLLDMLRVFKIKTVILGALFIFAYQGAEVSISGWVISFLISTRHGNPSAVGYVTSGFWGGITLGRFLLSHSAHKIGEKLFVYGMVIGAITFELLVWLVPNVITDAVAVAIVGFLLGPVFPCATVIFSRAIGRKDQVSGLSVVSAFGSSGGAVAPFTTGILAQAAGTFVLHPIAISLFAAMLICWYVLPNVRKRTE